MFFSERLRDESEIQERFRRDEMERQRARQGAIGAGQGDEAVEDEYDPRKTLMGDVLLALVSQSLLARVE
jgi:hypothetical protein